MSFRDFTTWQVLGYCKTSSISHTNSQMFLISSYSCLYPIHWSQVLSQVWRCGWSSADRRCSNYIWVINNFIAYYGATYITGFTVITPTLAICWHAPSYRQIPFTNWDGIWLLMYALDTWLIHTYPDIVYMVNNLIMMVIPTGHAPTTKPLI